MFTTSVFFNNFDLALLEGVSIYDHDFIGMPNRDLKSNKLARADRSLLTSAEYTNKPITITGLVCGSDKSDTELNFDALKAVIQVPEGLLRIEQSGSQVEYRGTLNGIAKEYYAKKLKFTLTFLCSNPIGKDQALTSLVDTNNTDSPFTEQFTVLGSFKAEPYFTLNFNTIVDGTNKTVSLLNAATTQGLRITNDFASGDLLTVDVANKEVTLNGNIIDFSGNYPTYYPGIRSFQYIDDFTDRDVDIKIEYNKAFA
jgi:phage-related protein